MRRALDAVLTWRFLRSHGIAPARRVVLEGRPRIQLGRGISVADGVRIRSRSGDAHVSVGSHCRFREGAEVSAKGDPVTIGAHCFIARDVWIGGCGRISIGDNTIIGIRTVVISSDHDYMSLATPYHEVAEVRKPVVIGDNVWIGCGCVILGGSVIGSGSVIGAGSVVAGEIPANSMVRGDAARVVRAIERP